MSDALRLNEGIHLNVPEAAYHADPCPEPSLSSGIARLLLRSPLHAMHAHPRFNLAHEDDGSGAADDGTILHKMVLGRGSDVAVIDADDWRTKAAKEARDAAREAGRVPVLAGRYGELEAAADAIHDAIATLPALAAMGGDGQPEATMIWREPKFSGAWCRARVDWLPDAPTAPLFDIKTTKLSADPREWQRRIVTTYCMQASWYLRGARALGRRPADFVFLVAECDPPHGIATMACAPSLLAYADAECERALAIWERCMKAGTWPGYPPHTAYVEAPPWLLMQQEERQLREEIMEDAQ